MIVREFESRKVLGLSSLSILSEMCSKQEGAVILALKFNAKPCSLGRNKPSLGQKVMFYQSTFHLEELFFKEAKDYQELSLGFST